MIKSKKYLIFGLGAMFVLNVLDIFTTFWNDPTLKSEVNPLFLKYSLGPFGLIVVLLVYQIIYSIFFTYHAYYFNGYNYESENKNYLDFTRRFLGFSNSKFAFSMNNFRCLFNLLGFYFFLDYCIGKTIVVIHNSFLALLSNNSTYKINTINNKVDIFLNDNSLWETFVGRIILNYNSYTISNSTMVFWYHYFIECVLVIIVLAIFFVKNYQIYLKVTAKCSSNETYQLTKTLPL